MLPVFVADFKKKSQSHINGQRVRELGYAGTFAKAVAALKARNIPIPDWVEDLSETWTEAEIPAWNPLLKLKLVAAAPGDAPGPSRNAMVVPNPAVSRAAVPDMHDDNDGDALAGPVADEAHWPQSDVLDADLQRRLAAKEGNLYYCLICN